MDHKSWLWKRRSTEKTIISDDSTNLSLSRAEEEAHLSDIALERDLQILNHKLSSVISECNSKDDFAKKQAKIAQEAIAGWEKTETEALSLKQELEKALQQRSASEERLLHVDAALKECMLQLRFVREEQEKRIHDAVTKTSKEFESARYLLDQRLAEANKRLAKVDGENSQLSKALLAKEKVIEELHKNRAQLEADFGCLMTRLESTEKENVSLKYEVRVIEKELEIRNEEREFNRRIAEVAQKQHLESVKKIAKLESECLKLRILVRKRLPGPAALAKMKNEVEMLGRNQAETRRRKANPSSIDSMDISADVVPDIPGQRINFLTEQLCIMEEENRILKEAVNKRMTEPELSGLLEGQFEGHETAEMEKNKHYRHTFSMASMSDMGSDDKAGCTESSASALPLELEQFRSKKQVGMPSIRTVGASDISLMDDFVEMEKLADDPPGANNHLAESIATRNPLRTQSSEHVPEAASTALIPVCDLSNPSESSQQVLSQNVSPDISFERIIQIVLEQSQGLKGNSSEILGKIKANLPQFCHQNSQWTDKMESLNQGDALYVTKNMSDRSHHVLEVDPSDKGTCNATENKSSQKLQFNLSKSLRKVIELIEGISISALDNGNTEFFTLKDDNVLHYKGSETPTGYIGRVFQWKASELSSTLKQFVQTCNDLLNGKSDLETFVEQLASTLEWIMNHCFSLQDVSSMKDAIRSYFDWDGSRSESDVDSGEIDHVPESNKLNIQKGEMCSLPFISASTDENSQIEAEKGQPNFRKEFGRLKDDLPNKDSAEHNSEGRLRLDFVRDESLINQLQESNKTIKTLQVGVESPEPMKENTSQTNQNHNQVKEVLERQIIETENELKEACQKLTHMEKELPNKRSSCQNLNGTYDDQELPIESIIGKRTVDAMANHGRDVQTDWEIVAASEKLAECQETILNLGKQLKALASPMEAALFDKAIPSPADPFVATLTTPEKNTRHRSSLLDKMLAEDKYGTEDKENILDGISYYAFDTTNLTTQLPTKEVTSSNGVKNPRNEAAIGPLAIVPSKKRGSGGLLKKLLRRGRKGSC